MQKELVKSLSPFPFVDLANPGRPDDGFSLSCSDYCKSHFRKNSRCLDFYMSLSAKPDGFYGCPHGLTACKLSIGGEQLSITGFIPFPRRGTAEERLAQKKVGPEYKLSIPTVETVIQAIRSSIIRIETQVFKMLRDGTHEMRKLNRTVVQESERVYKSCGTTLEAGLKQKLLSIWKAADIMSQQFKVIESLCDESAFSLPLKSNCNVNEAIFKFVSIYQLRAEERNIRLDFHDYGKIEQEICDKTFSVIFTSLIENAVKNSATGTVVSLDLNKRLDGGWQFSSENFSEEKKKEGRDLFEKWSQGDGQDGTGVGLFLVKKAVLQHGGLIDLFVSSAGGDLNKWRFVVTFPGPR